MRGACPLAGLLLAVTVVAPGVAQVEAEGEQPDPNAELRRAVDAAIDGRLRTGEQALLVAIVEGGEVLFASSRGAAGRERMDESGNAGKAIAATADSLFPLGGMTRFVANLVVAELAGTKDLTVNAAANQHLGSRPIRGRSGRAVEVSLGAVMRGTSGLPLHRNFLTRKELHEWPLQRALREHAIVMDRTATGSDLDYGVVQEVVEAVTSRPWADAVRRLVFEPAGVKRAIADARFGLPKTAVVPMQKGLFGIAFPEPNHFSNFVAANGAWADAADLGRLLVRLTRDRRSTEEAAGGVEFATFRKAASMVDRRPLLEMHQGMPGMRGSLRVYPEDRIAWIVLSNFARNDKGAAFGPIHQAIEQRILPKRKVAEAPEPGMGGMFLGGGVANAVPADFRGRWAGSIKFRGRDHELGLQVTKRGFEHAEFAGKKQWSVTGSRRSMTAPNLELGNLFPVRPGLRTVTTLRLKLDEETADMVFEGPLAVDHRYCHMEWWVRIRQQRR